MNCRVCNEPGAQHDMVDHDLNGDKKGTCFKCVVKQRDNLRKRYAKLAASVINEALEQAEVMVVEFGPDHPETKDLIKVLHNAGRAFGLFGTGNIKLEEEKTK